MNDKIKNESYRLSSVVFVYLCLCFTINVLILFVNQIHTTFLVSCSSVIINQCIMMAIVFCDSKKPKPYLRCVTMPSQHFTG